VNGDGFTDVIVGGGEGSTSRVRVFSGADGALLADFRPYAKAYRGGVRVAAGDVNGDGRADLIVAPAQAGPKVVKVLSAVTGAALSSCRPSTQPLAGGL